MYTKKLLALIITVTLIFSGCKSATVEDTNKKASYNYDFSIYDSKEIFSSKDLKMQKDFESFLNEIYVDNMSENTLNLHFSLENPEKYGITVTEPDWGEVSSSYFESQKPELKKAKTDLSKFKKASLTNEQDIIYDILKEYLSDAINSSDYYLFDSVFSPTQGIQSQIPIIFTDYAFLTEKDIEDFIILLEESDEYIISLCEFEMERLDNGYALSSYSIDKVIKQCNDFISGNPLSIISVFSENIKELSFITEDKKTDYVNLVTKAVNENLVIGYKEIISTLTTIKEKNLEKKGLSEYKDGSTYYEYLVKLKTGSNKTPAEMIKNTQKSIDSMLKKIYKYAIGDPDKLKELEDYKYFTNNPDEMISHLLKALEADFPKAKSTDYTLKYVHESLESSLSPAFYIVPPVDNPYKNIIYINEGEEYKNMPLFQTIAHETVPGHMYQSNYFSSLNPHYFRYLLSFNGYQEGYAEYIETEYSFKYAGVEEDLAELFTLNQAFSFALYSIADLSINYKSWSIKDLQKYLKPYGITDEKTVTDIYYTMVDDPGVYLSYYIGYQEILELKDTAKDILKDGFNLKEFHKFLLEIGPCQFDIIKKELKDWCAKVKE